MELLNLQFSDGKHLDKIGDLGDFVGRKCLRIECTLKPTRQKAGFVSKQSLPAAPQSVFAPKPARLFAQRTAIHAEPSEPIPASATVASRLPARFDFTHVPICRSSPVAIQPKLKVDPPDSPLEREADEVADKVMRMPDPTIQRISLDEEDEETKIQRKCAKCEEEDKLQRKATRAEPPTVTPAIQSRIESLKTGGQPLSASEKTSLNRASGGT